MVRRVSLYVKYNFTNEGQLMGIEEIIQRAHVQSVWSEAKKERCSIAHLPQKPRFLWPSGIAPGFHLGQKRLEYFQAEGRGNAKGSA